MATPTIDFSTDFRVPTRYESPRPLFEKAYELTETKMVTWVIDQQYIYIHTY